MITPALQAQIAQTKYLTIQSENALDFQAEPTASAI